MFAADNIKVTSDALDIIARRLGNDRGSSRREIEKLALMAGPNGTLEAKEVHLALEIMQSWQLMILQMHSQAGL